MNNHAKFSQESASLASELPYWDFFEGPRPHAVLFDGSIVAGVQASLIDIECWDSAAINQLTEGIRSTLNSISEGLTLQFYLNVGSDCSHFIDTHKSGTSQNAHPLIKKIAQKRESDLQASLAEGEFYKPELYIFLRTPMVQGQKLGFFKRPEKFAHASSKDYEETVEMIFQNLDTLTSSLHGLGIKSRPLSKSNLTEIVYRFLNPKRAQSEPTPLIKTSEQVELEPSLVQEVPWMAEQSPREQLVFGDLLLEFSHFTLDSYQHKVITLKTLPEITFAGQLANFLRLPFHYDMILSVEIPVQASEMAKLHQKRKMAHSLAATSGGRVSDLESETKLSSTEELIRELLSSGQRIYAAQMNIILKAPVGTDGSRLLSRQVKEVLSRFRALQGAEGLEESVGAWKVLKDALPLAPLNLERARRMKTNNLADFVPLYGPRMGDADPVVIFKNRLGGLVGYNPFDPKLPNYNTLVTGSSGAGKSFLNNCILLQEMARGLRVFIIDIGGSYKKITQALDGQYLEINLSDQYRLNPFDTSDIEAGPSNQKLKSLLAAIESMVSDDDKSKLAKLDRVLLEKEIIELYKKKAKDKMVPVLSDLVFALEKSKEPSMQTLAKLLYTWTGDRPYGRLLDGFGGLRTDAIICTVRLSQQSVI
ncbi:MAG TPA: TraC family protein [Bacteriovoracaceae bacterium]|nr:TraC family protein [Bacteriovoracaceae bacterium]